ncbi:MAG: response regulator [Elusimicrobia bacterium]|nr:response regulator [Elusimicrobiota bacterium]
MSEKILVLESDSSIYTLLENALRAKGFDILDIKEPAEALRRIQSERPALALIDIRLPKTLNGFEICRMITNVERLATEVLLISSTSVEEAERLKAYESGAIGFYETPLGLRTLADDISAFLSKPEPYLPLVSLAGALNVSAAPKVVVIDDDEDQLKAVAMNLQEQAFVPHIARSARRGIMLVHKLKPSAVILDVGLPDFSGVFALKALKSHTRTHPIPVYMWTGSEREGQELTSLNRGADEYLIKGAHDVSALPLRIKRRLGLS